MHWLSESDQGSEDKCLTSLSLNVLPQSCLKQSRDRELPICCMGKRTEILLKTGILAPARSHIYYLSLLYCPLHLSLLASKDLLHFTQYDYVSAPIGDPFSQQTAFVRLKCKCYLYITDHIPAA